MRVPFFFIYGQNLANGIVKPNLKWTLGTGAIGVIDGYYDILDIKGPPGYAPSGIEHLISGGFFTGQAVGSGIKSSSDYYEYRKEE